MGYRARKAEHAGSKKKAAGAYWGPRTEAKHESNRVRRETDKIEAAGLFRIRKKKPGTA
jgi:hypothetical protein